MNIKTPFKCYWRNQPEVVYTVTEHTDTHFMCNWVEFGDAHSTDYLKSSIHELIALGKVVIIPSDPLVTIKQSEYDDLIEEINALQELVKELSVPQDTALEQQAETYRALNETLTRHESFQEGEDGVFTTHCEELLNTIDFLHEVYDDWKNNDYRVAVASAGSDAFKPISEYTLEDWQQAVDEGWEFECRDGHTVQVIELLPVQNYPVRGDDSFCRTINGYWWVEENDDDDIIKRIR